MYRCNILLIMNLPEWKTVGDPQKAVELFVRQLKQVGVNQRTLVLTLDAMDTDEERDMSLISFYKHKREIIQWAAPFQCRIQGITSYQLNSTGKQLFHLTRLFYCR